MSGKSNSRDSFGGVRSEKVADKSIAYQLLRISGIGLKHSPYYSKDQFPGAKIRIPLPPDESERIPIKFSIDEPLLGKIK